MCTDEEKWGKLNKKENIQTHLELYIYIYILRWHIYTHSSPYVIVRRNELTDKDE